MWSQIPTFLRAKNGDIYTNPLKDYCIPFDLGIDRPNQVAVIAAGATGVEFPMSARHDGPIEMFALEALVFDANNAVVPAHNILFQVQHPGKRKLLSNRPINLRTCQGDGGRFYVLPETIWLPAIQSLMVAFTNNDGAERRVEFIFHGVKYYPHAAPDHMREEIYAYTERRERTYCYWQTTDQPITLAGSAVGTEAVYSVPDDADLEIFRATAVSDNPFRIEHVDGQTDRAYTSHRLHSSLFFGGFEAVALAGIGGAGGIFPKRWATSLLVRRSVRNRFVLDNLVGTPNNVFITLGGRKVSYV